MYQTAFIRHSFFLLFILTLTDCSKSNKQALPYYNSPDFTPEFQVTGPLHTIANFECTDQHGKSVTQHTIEGKIHVAGFFFTGCSSICPALTSHMKKISDAFEKDTAVVLLSYSVTPWIDNPTKLNIYAQSHDINNPNWHLLTGNKTAIYNLARQSYFAEERIGFTKDSTEFLHTEHLILVDANKHIRGIYNGTLAFDVQQLIHDIRELKKENGIRR